MGEPPPAGRYAQPAPLAKRIACTRTSLNHLRLQAATRARSIARPTTDMKQPNTTRKPAVSLQVLQIQFCHAGVPSGHRMGHPVHCPTTTFGDWT